jgi:ferredoxin
LNSAGIQVIAGISGTVRQAIDQFKTSSIVAAGRLGLASRFGMNRRQDMAMGSGMGRGRGIGRGVSRGRIIERGMLRHSGQRSQSVNKEVQLQMTREEQIAFLREEARDLEKKIQDLKRRIDQAQKGKVHGVAHVDSQQCQGCGVCITCCPVGAIAVDDVAVIDTRKCIGCGACVAECPFDAISMV